MNWRPVVAIMAGASLSACALAPMQGQPGTAHAQSAVAYRHRPHYRLTVSDVVKISVWHNKSLSETVPVRPDGRVSMPLIGAVAAAGHTPSRVAREIQAKLSYYVRDPQVTVIVKKVSDDSYKDRVRITGAVEHQISVNYEPGMTVLDAVLDAGGINSFAAPNDTEIHRRVGNREKVLHVRLGSILHDGRLGTDYPLKPGDVVTIPQRLF